MMTSLQRCKKRIASISLFSKPFFIVLFSFLFAAFTQAQTINAPTLSPGGSYCAGASVTVNFTTSGTFADGNTFTAQLSEPGGTFGAGADDIGTVQLDGEDPSGSIDATIPADAEPGSTYRIRVVSSDPDVNGTVNATDLSVGPPTAFDVTGGGTFCTGGAGVPIGLSGSQTGVKYQLQRNGVNSGVPVAGTGSAIRFNNQTTAGTYTVVATNNASSTCTTNMTGSAVITVSATGAPTVFNLTGGGAYCAGGAGPNIILSGSQVGVEYTLYRLAADNITRRVRSDMGTGAAINFGPKPLEGTYSVVAENTTLGCTANMAGNPEVTITPLPTTYTVTGGGTASCITGVVVGLSNSQTGVNYQLLRNGSPVFTEPSIPGTGSAISFGNQTMSGTYTVRARNVTTGCISVTTSSKVVTTTNVVVTPVHVSACRDADASITVAVASGGPYEYSINNGAFGSSNTFTGLSVGTYPVQVQEVGNPDCNASFNIEIRKYNPVAASLYYRTTESCRGSDAQIVIAARNGPLPYTYTLTGTTSTGAAISRAAQNSNAFGGLAAGTYSVLVTDATGCTTTVSAITIAKATPPTASLYYKTTTSCNANDAQIVIAVRGGRSPYRYSKDNGQNFQTSNTFTGLGAGAYTILVQDANGCFATVPSIAIAQATPPTASVYYKTTTSCIGNDAQLVIAVKSGKLPYTYTLNEGASQTSNTFTGLGAGTYSVTVTDARGCTSTISGIRIVNAPLRAIVYSKTNVSCLNGTNGSITATRSGGIAPFQYSLAGAAERDFQTSGTFSNLGAGTYTITVRDSKGCTATVETVINNGTTACIAGRGSSSTDVKVANTGKSLLKVQATPNPSRNYFTLNLQSKSTEKVQIVVTDMLGRRLYQASGSGNQQYTFGQQFLSGTYITQVRQGTEIQTIKLIKGK